MIKNQEEMAEERGMGHKFRYTVLMFLLLSISLTAQQGNTDYQYALIEAVKQKNLGNLPGAIVLYRMVLEENDSVAVAHYELGTLYAVTGNFVNARFHLERANELDPYIHWYFISYIDVLLVEKEYRLAEKQLKIKIKADAGNRDYLYKLANVYFLAKKSRKAIRILEKMEKRWGFSDKITLLKANIYEEQGDFRKALHEVGKIIEIFPESVELRVVAAELAMKIKNKDLAADYYLGVFELDSMNIYSLTNLTDYYREKDDLPKSFFYMNKSFESDEIDYDRKMAILGFYLSDENLIREQEDQLRKLIETMLVKYEGKREIQLLATDFFIRNKQYDEALDAILPLLNKGEGRYELWRQGILLANATGRNMDMLKLTEYAYESFPDSAEIIYFKGIAEFELKKYDKLPDTFSDDVISKVEDQEVLSQMKMLLAESYYQVKEYEKSDSIFRLIIRDDPSNYMAMNNFSYYLSLRGESLKEAEELSRLTIENNPENETFLDTYAWILFNLGEYEEAERYIIQALQHGGENNPVINEHAADIYNKLGSAGLAKTFYQKAIMLGGDKEKLICKLEKMNEKDEE